VEERREPDADRLAGPELGAVALTAASSLASRLPFLIALFSFVLVNNLWGIFPLTLLPTASHVGWAYGLAGMVWLIYNGVGIAKHGPFGYLKHTVLPSGVPKAMYGQPSLSTIEGVRVERGRLPGSRLAGLPSSSQYICAREFRQKPISGMTGELCSQPPLGVAETMLPCRSITSI
jgi:hypothetical protein